MKTIEDLKEEKTYFKNEKDEQGNVNRVAYTKLVPRTPETVKTGVRFGYYVIDVVFIYIIAFIIGIFSAIAGVIEIWDDPIISRLLGMLIFVSYYFITEVTMGTSLGKLILGYTVINKFAQKPSAAAFLGRSFARAVPFEAFSCFAERGWHDKWSDTYVVKNSEKIELQKLMGVVNDKNDLLD